MPNGLPAGVERQIEKGVAILKRGGVIAFPTDTIYGVGSGANIQAAVERVYAVKERPLTMPLPLLLATVKQIDEVADRVTPQARTLAEKFLPGALTLVLPKKTTVLDIVTAGGATVAVRVPAHPVPRALASGLGTPIVGTSANLSGQPNALTADEVSRQLDGRIDLIIDDGPCPGGRESTVIDVSGEYPVVLREGALTIAELEAASGLKIRRKT